MELQAKQDFPETESLNSVMIGDSISDMEFSRKLGMRWIFIHQKNDIEIKNQETNFELKYDSLFTFAKTFENEILD